MWPTGRWDVCHYVLERSKGMSQEVTISKVRWPSERAIREEEFPETTVFSLPEVAQNTSQESGQCSGIQRKHTHPGHQRHIVKPKGQFKETHTPPSRLGGWGDGQMNQVLGVNATYQTANKSMSSLSICEFRQKFLTLQILFSDFQNFSLLLSKTLSPTWGSNPQLREQELLALLTKPARRPLSGNF